MAVCGQEGKIRLERRADLLRWAEPRICAFDIETTKLPLQFPNSEYDQARARGCDPLSRTPPLCAHSLVSLSQHVHVVAGHPPRAHMPP